MTHIEINNTTKSLIYRCSLSDRSIVKPAVLFMDIHTILVVNGADISRHSLILN